MFKQIAALLRPRAVEPVAVADSVEFPVKRKPAVKKVAAKKVATKVAAKPPAKKVAAKKSK